MELNPFPESSAGSWWKNLISYFKKGHFYDLEVMKNCIRANVGDYTFEEAYVRTGRITNITVAPSRKGLEMPRLLNYITSPDVVSASGRHNLSMIVL